MTGIIVMMMMRARTEIREMMRAGENLLVGNGGRIAMAGPSSWGLAGAFCQPQVGTVRQQTSKWLIKSQKTRKTQ
jgi:hypothetical protein